ncbi:MAG: T9SS type A sorting domain-containing protein [Bacteroidota bacterium]|nr:T9SS type A sorting domain-containing protein [Bacteroidota bacterium]
MTDNLFLYPTDLTGFENLSGLNGTPSEIGDKIAALGENNQLVGKTIFNGGFTAVTIYGDDYYTPGVLENLAINESFTFEVWNAASKSTTHYRFKNWEKGNGLFSSNEIAVVGVDEDEEIEAIIEIELYPNPGDGRFMLDILSTVSGDATIKLYDISGKQVYYDIVNIIKSKQSIKLDFTSLEIGTYTLTLVGDDISKQAKLVIIK